MSAVTSRIDALTENIVSINPLQRNFISESVTDIHDEEMRDLDAYISFTESLGIEPSYLAECYDLIVKDTLREQMYFQRHGRYRYSTFDDVANSVYFDAEYMRKYMHGLAITAYLWPNHRALHRFFIESIPTDHQGRYLEVGPGHGVFMMCAMRQSAYESFEGIDISPTSVEMTRTLLGSGFFGNFGVLVRALTYVLRTGFFCERHRSGRILRRGNGRGPRTRRGPGSIPAANQHRINGRRLHIHHDADQRPGH